MLAYVRIGLLLCGVALFTYALNSGADWARVTAIVLVALALVSRFLERLLKRR